MSLRAPRPDALDTGYVHAVRSNSMSSSDVMSASAKSVATSHVPPANPPPAYIAQAEASELISAELEHRVTLAPAALTLVNEFLDHVLYSLILTSNSVHLTALKQAVPSVLKPRLGKAALRVAEEELKEYLEDEDEEELVQNKRASVQPVPDFDVDLVWKLARLRCMVYARMGDLEEEDEEEWLEKEHLLEQTAATPTSAARQSMEIGPAAAIFLTSVIEYLGEQALYYAAQHAQKKHDVAKARNAAAPATNAALLSSRADDDDDDDVIILDGKDMNHVGRDSPLSRLWRSWRRNTRTSAESFSRPMSPESNIDSPYTPITATSTAHPIDSIIEERQADESSAPKSPADIPLPISDNDVAEIEGYGFWTDGFTQLNGHRRPLSLQIMPGQFQSFDHDEVSDVEPPPIQERSPLRPSYTRLRSSSVPMAQSTPPDIFSMETPPESAVVLEEDEDQPEEPSTSTAVQDVDAEDKDEEHESLPIQRPEDASMATMSTSVDTSEKQQPIAPVHAVEPKHSGDSQQSGLVNNTIAALAGTFGAVGVYQVRNRSPHAPTSADGVATASSAATSGQSRSISSNQVVSARQRIEATNKKLEAVSRGYPRASPPAKRTESPNQPLTSAAITSPTDFDGIHLPDRRMSPEVLLDDERRDLGTPLNTSRPPTSSRREDVQAPQSENQTGSTALPGAKREESRLVPPPEPHTTVHDAVTQPPPIVTTAALQGRSANPVSPVSPPSPTVRYSSNAPVPASTTVPSVPSPSRAVQQPNDELAQHTSPSHSKSSSSSSRLLGFTRDASGKPQTIHQQRATGDMADAVRAAYSATPTSVNRSIRPETSNSSESKKRGHLRIRGDSETSVPRASPIDEVAQRNLELLINSDETLHYTLTPATATFRQEDVVPSPKRTQMQDLADFFRNTAPPPNEVPRPKSARSKQASIDASRAIPAATTVPAPAPDVQRERKVIPSSKSVNAPVMLASARPRNPLGEPRGAKVERTNVLDLADYARSTGPTTNDQLPQMLASTSPGSVARSPASTTQPVLPSSKGGSRPKNRLKFQARDPRPTRTAENAALIDFIREGPPREPGDHRINRHVAPFRTTMDSDDLNALASSVDRSSTMTNGDRASDNSRTPLVTAKGRGVPASNVVQREVSAVDADEGMPRRTQRRVKDPYAIDESDDETFNQEARPQRDEESLIDFLRNTAPSQSMTAQPILHSTEQAKANLQRSPSGSKLKELVRGKSLPSLGQSADVMRGSQARAESPHLTQAGTKLDSYRPTQTTHAAHVDRNRASKVRNEARVPAPAASSRGVGATADLADYLKNTGPPPGQSYQPQPFILSSNNYPAKKPANGSVSNGAGEGGLKKFFSLRAKK